MFVVRVNSSARYGKNNGMSPGGADTYRIQSSIQVLYDLCQYPEYFEALRMEAETHSGSDEKLELSAEKPLLDSFIKESNRVTPGEASWSTPAGYQADRSQAAPIWRIVWLISYS